MTVKKENTKKKKRQKKVVCTSRIDELGSDYSHGEGSDDSEATDCNASKSNAAKKETSQTKAKKKAKIETEERSEGELEYGVKMATNYRVVGKKTKQIQYQLQWESENEAGIPFATYITRDMWERDLSETLGWKVHYNKPCLSREQIEARFLELDRAREENEAKARKKAQSRRTCKKARSC